MPEANKTYQKWPALKWKDTIKNMHQKDLQQNDRRKRNKEKLSPKEPVLK